MSAQPTKRRRRLRLSCIECTSRRQRCDRQTPCALCIKRGIPELCVYSAEPFSRPIPGRNVPIEPLKKAMSPSSDESGSDDSQRKIQELYQQIANLEHTIVNLKIGDSSGTNDENLKVKDSRLSLHSEAVEPDLLPEGSRPFDFETFSAVSFAWRAKLVNPFEYVGEVKDSGMFLGKAPRVGDAAQLPTGGEEEPEDPQRLKHLSLTQVDASLPPPELLQVIIQRFLQHESWRFGIETEWLLEIQRAILNVPGIPGSRFSERHCTKLSVLFAAIAITLEGYTYPPQFPLVGDASFFVECALSCRQIGIYSRHANSIEQSCMAVLVIVHYFTNTCRYAEAWVILGHALRDAISIGLHELAFGNNIGHDLSIEKLVLKRRIWYSLVMPERFYSKSLGRPPMVNDDIYNKGLEINDHFTGLQGYDAFLQLEVKLWDIMIEASGKVFEDGILNSRFVFTMDRKIEIFDREVANTYQVETFSHLNELDLAPKVLRFTLRYWSTLQRRSVLCRTKMHMVSMLHGKPLKRVEETRLSFTRKQSRDICISLVREVLGSQLDLIYASNVYNQTTDCEPVGDWIGNNWMFEGCVTMFDGCVVAIGLMTQAPVNERSFEHERLVDETIRCLRILSERCTANRMAETSYSLLTGLSQHQDWRKSAVEATTPLTHSNISFNSDPISLTQQQQQQTVWDFMDPSFVQPDMTLLLPSAPTFDDFFYAPVQSIGQLDGYSLDDHLNPLAFSL